MSGKRKKSIRFVFRIRSFFAWIMALVVLPLLLLSLAEGGLRLAGYGKSTQFWVTKTIGDESYRLPNKEFYQQFYSLPFEDALWREFEFAVPIKKQDSAYRVFVFGGSAAMGVPPDPAYAFWRVLEIMLEARFPEKRFEFYCAAMAGANSTVMRPAALACAAMQPDLFVVYMGNNEICGPMGPTSELGWLSVRGQAWVQTFLWLGDLRLTQWLTHTVGSESKPGGLFRKSPKASIEYLSPDDPRSEASAALFASNLEDIYRAARSANADVVLCTVPSNLRDWAPYCSGHRPDLSTAEQTRWEEEYAAGIEKAGNSRYEEASKHFTAALSIDGSHAELQFRLAQSLWHLGQYEAAKEHFIAARERDFWLIRAGNRANTAIREVAARQPGELLLADAESSLQQQSPHGVLGAEFFYDQVHLNFAGNYAIGAAVYEQIAPGINARLGRKDSCPRPLSYEICAERLAFTPAIHLDHVNGYIDVFNRPNIPVLDKDENLPVLSAQKEQLLSEIGAENPLEMNRRAYEHALASFPFDHVLGLRMARLLVGLHRESEALPYARKLVNLEPCTRKNRFCLAETLTATGNLEGVRREFELLAILFPDDTDTLLALSNVSQEMGDIDSAESYFRKGLFKNPDQPVVLQQQAELLEARGDLNAAIAAYQKACAADIQDPTPYLRLARLLLKQHQSEQAVEELRRAAERFPDFPQIRFELAKTLQTLERGEEALASYRNVYNSQDLDRLSRAEAHACAGNLLAAQGQFHDAQAEFIAAIGIQPQFTGALSSLEMLLKNHVDPAQQAAIWRRIVSENSDTPLARACLGRALLSQGDLEGAFSALESACHENVDDPFAFLDLATLLENRGQQKRALELLETAAQRYPEHVQLNVALATLYYGFNRSQEAISTLQKILETPGLDSWSSAEIHTQMGDIFSGSGKSAEAADAYQQAIDAHPVYPEVYPKLELLLNDQRTPPERVSVWQNIVAKHPQEPRAQIRLARAFQEQGDFSAAISAYQTACSTNYLDPSAYAGMTALLLQQNRGEEAVGSLMGAVERFPESPQLRVELGKVYQKLGRLEEAYTCFEEARASNNLNPIGQQELEARMAEIPADIQKHTHADQDFPR